MLNKTQLCLIHVLNNNLEKQKQNLNPFASQRLVFKGKIKLFLFENASNLPHEFLYDNFNKKSLLNFLVKIVKQKLKCQI